MQNDNSCPIAVFNAIVNPSWHSLLVTWDLFIGIIPHFPYFLNSASMHFFSYHTLYIRKCSFTEISVPTEQYKFSVTPLLNINRQASSPTPFWGFAVASQKLQPLPGWLHLRGNAVIFLNFIFSNFSYLSILFYAPLHCPLPFGTSLLLIAVKATLGMSH